MVSIMLVAKNVLLTTIVSALVFAAGALAFLFFFLATVSYAVSYEGQQNDDEAIFLCLLNLSTLMLAIPAAIGAFNPGRVLYFNRFWPTGALLAISGITLLITAAIVMLMGSAFALTIIDADGLAFLILSNIINSLAAALFAAQFSASKDTMRRYGVIYFTYSAAVVHVVSIVLFLGQITDGLVLAVLWPELAAALLIPVSLSWRGMAMPYTLLGLAAAVAMNMAAWFYALSFYAVVAHTGSILNAITSAGIPLLLFLVILLRRYRLRSRCRNWQ